MESFLKKKTRGDKVFDRINTLFWLIVLFFIIYPLWLIIIASVSSPEAIIGGKVFLWPVDFSVMGYQAALQYKLLPRSYLNSLFYTLAGSGLSVIVTMMAAYALTRRFRGRKVVNFYFIFTMFFTGGLIPQFLMNGALHLRNTVLLMVIINCVSIWNLMIARTFIGTTIPNELYEAAAIDGAGHFTYFFRVVLPLSGTIIAVLAVYYGVARWNDYFTALVYMNKREWLPLQMVLKELIASYNTTASNGEMLAQLAQSGGSASEVYRKAEVLKYCCIVISTLPTIVMYTFMQRFFVKGVTLGSMKG